MRARTSKFLILTLAAAMTLAAIDAAAAKRRQSGVRVDGGESAFWSGLRTENGVPIIMEGYHPPPRVREPQPSRRADRPVRIPRGSSTYITPVNPAPNAFNSPPAQALRQPNVQPYNPPPITTFNDRVIDAIHAYPLAKGLGNNPVDQQMFIRQRVNQP